jgi:small subunit ribosomal protein S18
MSDEAAPTVERPRDDRPPREDRPAGPPRDDRPSGPPRERREYSPKSRLRARARKKARKGKKKTFQRRKVCRFCADKKVAIDYKEPRTLRLFISETGKVTPRRISGTCAKHQRSLAVAIKRARQIAFLPYAPSHM